MGEASPPRAAEALGSASGWPALPAGGVAIEGARVGWAQLARRKAARSRRGKARRVKTRRGKARRAKARRAKARCRFFADPIPCCGIARASIWRNSLGAGHLMG